MICGATRFLIPNAQILWLGVTSMKGSVYCFFFPGVPGQTVGEEQRTAWPFLSVSQAYQVGEVEALRADSLALPFCNSCLPTNPPQLSPKSPVTSLLPCLRHLTFTETEKKLQFL